MKFDIQNKLPEGKELMFSVVNDLGIITRIILDEPADGGEWYRFQFRWIRWRITGTQEHYWRMLDICGKGVDKCVDYVDKNYPTKLSTTFHKLSTYSEPKNWLVFIENIRISEDVHNPT